MRDQEAGGSAQRESWTVAPGAMAHLLVRPHSAVRVVDGPARQHFDLVSRKRTLRAGSRLACSPDDRSGAGSQPVLDSRNAAFWDELCGSAMARPLGITDASPESLERFDREFLAHYPTCCGTWTIRSETPRCWRSGSDTARSAASSSRPAPAIHGVEIAEGPVEMARHRSRLAGVEGAATRVVPRLGVGAVGRQAVRLRLHDRLPASHRQPAAGGAHGARPAVPHPPRVPAQPRMAVLRVSAVPRVQRALG